VKVEFARMGGVAGMRLAVTVDTERLPAVEAEGLRRLVADAALFDLPAVLKSPTPRPDQFLYRVAVEDGKRTTRVEMDESSVPDSARPLLEYLIASARPARKIRRS
jgi:hypothetical protein